MNGRTLSRSMAFTLSLISMTAGAWQAMQGKAYADHRFPCCEYSNDCWRLGGIYYCNLNQPCNEYPEWPALGTCGTMG